MTDGPDLLHGVLSEIWDRLQGIHQLRIVATSNAPLEVPWKGTGDGTVDAQVEGPMIIFTETGTWRIGQAHESRFRNVYRWSLAQGKIGLEHLRYGPSRPVHLFDLIPGDYIGTSETARLVPGRPHRCGDDVYEGVLAVAEVGVVLDWTIQGPNKSARVHIHYS